MLSAHSSAPDRQTPLRILYAEDVPELRDLIRAVFARDGHHVECAPDGVAALDVLANNHYKFDLLITDHHMPRMNGLDFMKNVCRLPYHGKRVVFSSELSPAISAEYQALGVDRMLFKPVYPSYLRQVLEELFPATAPQAR
jgi:CheY-like chemotaxis protein